MRLHLAAIGFVDDLLSHTMRCGQHMIGCDERGATMELSIVHQTRHPWILIDAGRSTADYANFLVRRAAVWITSTQLITLKYETN